MPAVAVLSRHWSDVQWYRRTLATGYRIALNAIVLSSLRRQLSCAHIFEPSHCYDCRSVFFAYLAGTRFKPIHSISFMRIKMAGDKAKRRLQKLRPNASPAHCYSQGFSCFASGEANGPGARTIASSPTSCVAQTACGPPVRLRAHVKVTMFDYASIATG